MHTPNHPRNKNVHNRWEEKDCKSIGKIPMTLKIMVISVGRKAMPTPGIFPLQGKFHS